jgi:hypothetical protein
MSYLIIQEKFYKSIIIGGKMMTENKKNNNSQEIKSNYIKEEQFEKIRECQRKKNY